MTEQERIKMIEEESKANPMRKEDLEKIIADDDLGLLKLEDDRPKLDMNQEADRLVAREVNVEISSLINQLMYDEKYCEDFSDFYGQDEKGNVKDIYEYWSVSQWLAEKLREKGELVTEFFDLNVWGRQTCGQLISMDSVIQDIVQDVFKPREI